MISMEGQQFEVTPDHLRTVAGEVLDLIDAVHQHARFLGGAQDGLNGAPAAYDSGRALSEIEHGWQLALHAANAKAAIDADTLSINADSYTLLEQDGVRRLQPS
jgi:hypothetical protein